MATNWDARFFESTRGRIVTLLGRWWRTVEELARVLDLTDNGVRAHLAVLERDGMVRQRGSVRRGGGKPAYVYELTSEAEDLFPKAYAPPLGRLLDVLSERLGPEESEALLSSAGRRLVEGKTVPTDGTRARLEAAAGVLNELGGLRGYGRPLAAVTPDHPEVAGVPFHERCERSEGPRCCFEVALAGVRSI